MDIEKISRRSFLKKTTVLTVGVASMTLFSGLVDAQNGSSYYVPPCAINKEESMHGTTPVWICSATGPVCTKSEVCGTWIEEDGNGNPVLDPNGKVKIKIIEVDCSQHRGRPNDPVIFCFRSSIYA